MKKFITGIVLDETEYIDAIAEAGNENPYYEFLASGDYIVHTLIDITDENNPIVITTNDNIHSAIETEIEGFLKGIAYSGIEYSILKKAVFVTKGSPYNITYKELRRVR